jgi:hypothetical protein
MVQDYIKIIIKRKITTYALAVVLTRMPMVTTKKKKKGQNQGTVSRESFYNEK